MRAFYCCKDSNTGQQSCYSDPYSPCYALHWTVRIVCASIFYSIGTWIWIIYTGIGGLCIGIIHSISSNIRRYSCHGYYAKDTTQHADRFCPAGCLYIHSKTCVSVIFQFHSLQCVLLNSVRINTRRFFTRVKTDEDHRTMVPVELFCMR